MVVICIWCALFVASQFDSCFQTNVLAKFVDIICIFSTSTSLILYVIALNINHQCSKAVEEKQTQRYDTAVHNCKISGCALKQGIETHSSYVRAIYNCKIRLR